MNDNANEEIGILKKKVLTHFKKNLLLHVSFKNGRWGNGKVLEVSSDFFIFDEFFEGQTPVFFQEIREVSTYSQQTKNRGRE